MSIQPNGIGQFIIGVSPIGNQNPFDFTTTILSQYANSQTLTQLIENLNTYLDQTGNYDNFYDNIWNILTAQGYGLDVWGRIVGVSRVVQLSTSTNLGLSGPSGKSGDSLNVQPFYSGGSITNNFSLSDDSFRTLILAKALANISDGSIPAINQILLNLFPNRGNCYCTDGENMTMTYTFKFALTAVELAVVSQSGVLPKPVGVSSTVVVIL